MFPAGNEKREVNMSTQETKQEIAHLKKELKASSQASHYRLLKLAFVVVIAALVAAYMTGHIQVNLPW
jgi:Zn-dependent peptidase ImmA (M78 family)